MKLSKFGFASSTLSLTSALVLGISGSADALPLTSNVSTFDSSSSAPSFTTSFTLTNAGSNINTLVSGDYKPSYIVINSNSSPAWTINTTNFPNCTTAYTTANNSDAGSPPSICGITLGSDALNNIVRVYVPNNNTIQLNFIDGGGAGSNTNWAFGTKTFDLTFANGLWNTKTAGTIPFTISANGSQYRVNGVDGATMTGWAGPIAKIWTTNLNVNSTVTFDANDGSGSTSVQAGRTTTALTSNQFTRPGYVFLGWANSPTDAANQQTSYANGANYNFVTGGTRTLYASWERDNSVSSNSSSSNSGSNLALTGMRSTLFIASGALGISLIVLGGVMVFSRRMSK